MNLIDLINRKDRLLSVGNDLPIKFITWQGVSWRAVELNNSDTPQLVIDNVSKVHALKTRPMLIGWYASCEKKSVVLKVILENENLESSIEINIGKTPVPINIPWPLDGRMINEGTKLKLHFQLPKKVSGNILVHRRLDRNTLISFAKGRGVELGPGPSPQILVNEKVEKVSYVEETPADRWKELYDHSGKHKTGAADFSQYIIGTAWDIPDSDGTLDFIFSSHVFEHLANPIGHLLRWKNKLKSGGVILAVVPDIDSTKDYPMLPSSIDEIRHEYETGIKEPNRDHYNRWVVLKGNKYDVDELIRTKTSIHVHFYNPTNLSLLLNECVNKHGYSDYSILHGQNHKDFYFCLWK